MKNKLDAYKLTEKEKQDMIKRLSNDISFSDDDLFDSEQDVSNVESEDQDETDLF